MRVTVITSPEPLLRTGWQLWLIIPSERGEQGGWIMAMTRRNFIEAGIGGVAALSAAQGMARAQSADAGQIIVIGGDDSNLFVRTTTIGLPISART